MTASPLLGILLALGLLVLGAGAGAAMVGAGPTPKGYSAAALYNQGNAEARAGRPALAVLNYARARILAPWDDDIRANLLAVRRSAGLTVQAESWFTDHARFASPNAVYWCGIVGLVLFGGGLISRRLVYVRRKPAAILIAFGLVMMLSSIVDVLATRTLLRQSVVLHSAAARAAPVNAGDPLFTLAAAELVEVQEQHRDFVLVRDSSGRQGWTARSDLMSVLPQDAGL